MMLGQSRAETKFRTAPLPDATCEGGEQLRELSGRTRVLLLFLRHWGCPFCREMLRGFAPHREELRANRVETVFVHMGSPDRARPYFQHYGLDDVLRISDPEQQLYRHPAFGIPARNAFQYLSDVRGARRFLGGLAYRNGFALFRTEDITQMPGAFVLEHHEIVHRHRYRSVAEQLDYLRFVSTGVAG